MTMTVKELRDALATMPEDMPVKTEGCDCNGNAVSVIRMDDYVYISRESQQWWDQREDRQKEYETEQERIAAEQRSRGLIA